MRVFCAIFAIIMFLSSAASAFDLETGQYYFRYKGNAGYSVTNPGEDDGGYAKDITVFYVGGVGHAFSERLPLKPQWEDDSWQIVSGTLPSGISFDPVTRVFSGTPDAPASGVEVEMIGIDDNGKQIADATVTFDIFVLPDNVQSVDLYAHTNKYIAHSLPLPDGISVFKWERVYPAPKGVEINERFFDGTPTQEGITPVLIQGYNYLGEAVIAYMGKYTVENGPSFPFIPDDYGNIDIKKLFREVNRTNTRINRAIGDPNLVRYFVELNPSDPLPGTLQIGGNVSQRTIVGKIYNPYEDGSVRFRALDIDGTEGYSNWFKIGALGPDPQCKPTAALAENGQIRIPGVVDKRMTYTVPFEGAIGTRNYVLVNPPALPAWLSFDNKTGLFSGTPTEKTTIEDINVRIELTNLGNVDTETCGPYTIEVSSADLSILAKAEERDIRAGDEVSIAVTTQGKLIAPYSITLDPESVLPAGLQFDSQTLTMKGIVNQVGDYSAKFILANGDGRTLNAAASFRVYPPLDIFDVSLSNEIPRYNVNDNFIPVTFDKDTVIGLPKLSLVGTLPAGFFFNAPNQRIEGGTKLPEGEYGPFQIKLSDDTGEEDLTAPFTIKVTPREDMLPGDTNSATATVGTEVSHTPFTVIQPPLATDLPLTYSLSGPPLPPGLVFADGRITGTPSLVGEYNGYSLRVTDSEQKSANSELFSVTIEGEDETPITPLTLPETVGNVTGQIPTFMTTGSIDLSSKAAELVGGVAAVKFKSASPMIGGLTFNAVNGEISGSPTEEFDGVVSISYEDGAGRPGVVKAPIKILPYPTLSPSAEYLVPRHEDLSKKNLRVTTNKGWRGNIQWSVDATSAPLPAGVQFEDGQFIGTTAVALGAYPSIVVRAHDSLTGLFVVSAPFTLNVVPGSDMQLNLVPGTINFYLDQGQMEVRRDVFAPASLIPSGTYVEPLRYSMIGDTPPGLGIDPVSGQFTNAPITFGEWPVTIRVTDVEGRSADAEVAVIAVLDGVIEPLIDGLPASGQSLKTARVGETIATPVVTFRNIQGDYTLSLNRPVPLGMDFNYRTARFYGMFSAKGEFEYRVTALDNGGRELSAPLTYPFNIVAPLSIPSAEDLYEVKQYTPSGISLNLPKAENILGEASYMFSGTVPGSLVIRDYSTQGQAYYLLVAANGDVSPILPGNLPLDAIVFDTKEATLTGVATQLGLFSGLTYVAEDNHMDKYLVMSDPTRVAHNTATSKPFAIQVNLPDPIELNVADYKTKPGFVFSMAAPWTETDVSHGNTYGAVNYFLTTGDAAAYPELSLDTQTGALSGSFATTGIRRVNINVSDITNRLTSKTVTVEVMPNLRLIVPQTVYLNSNGQNSESIGVDYAIGDVTFEKGSGDWPVGVSVDPATGAIIGQPQGGIEEYRNLTIVGTDAAGDRQVSNVFRIVSRPIGPYVLMTQGQLPAGLKRTAYSYSVLDNLVESQEVNLSEIMFEMKADQQGQQLPPGLRISNGELTGTPLASGTFNFTIRAYSQTNPSLSSTQEYQITIGLPELVLDFTTSALDDVDQASTVDLAFSDFVTTKNIPLENLVWTVTADKAGQVLPPGLTLSGSQYSGIVTQAGDFSFTLNVSFTDGEEHISASVDLTLTVIASVNFKQMAQISNALNTTCGLEKSGDVYCWGLGSNGALGNGTTGTNVDIPVQVLLSEKAVDIGIRDSHACAVGVSGNVYCWGQGTSWQLGNGNKASNVPLQVLNLPEAMRDVETATAVSCAISRTDKLYCWGAGPNGQAAATISTPTQVNVGGVGVKSVSLGASHGCAVLVDNTARCWGTTNSNGQLGNNTLTTSRTPVVVSGLTDVERISAASNVSCAVRTNGRVSCWGSNQYGFVGVSPISATNYRIPNEVAGLSQMADVSVGTLHVCATDSSAGTYCWGLNGSGQFGNGTTSSTATGVPTQSLATGMTNISVNGNVTCGLKNDGSAYCWGQGNYGKLGTGSSANATTPTGVFGFHP